MRAALPVSSYPSFKLRRWAFPGLAQRQSWAIWGLACTRGGPGCPTTAHAALRRRYVDAQNAT